MVEPSEETDARLQAGGDISKSSESSPLQSSSSNRFRLRSLVAFWILGLCNNYGYVVMLSAAHDILLDTRLDTLSSELNSTPATNTSRDCNQVSTGAILLADILPSLAIKLTAPFLPFYVHQRIATAITLSSIGFLLVALASSKWMAILGVISTSLASGLGEVTLLSYSTLFDKNVISTWSSGTGGAGILGSISYTGLIEIGMSPRNALLCMLVVPALMGVAFWIVLKHPIKRSAIPALETAEQNPDIQSASATAFSLQSFTKKLKIVPSLFVYMIPIGLVYLFEYFINQGLFELINFEDTWLSHAQQYRWMQVDYQLGVFISRSSVNFVTINKIWVMAVLQFLNVVVFTFEVLYFYIPSIWIVFALVLWEGLLGGAAYVNTFYKMAKEVPIERQEFSMGVTSLADSVGITLAGFASIPVHNAICRLPRPS